MSAAPRLGPSRRHPATPFAPRVAAAGAKSYTIYNRTLLPSVFRSLEEDYRHLKQHVQLWDVSCQRQVEVTGPDAARLVQYMTPRDLSKAQVGQCLYAPLVDAAGGMINDPVILKLAEDRFWLSIADSDVALWARGLAQAGGFAADVGEPDVSPLAVQGPKAEELMARVFGEAVRGIRFFRFSRLAFEDHPLLVARSGWSKQGGFEIYLDRRDLGLALWDRLMEAGVDLQVGPGGPNLIERIEAGLLSYGNDMTRENNPLECGLDRYCNLDRPLDCIGHAALVKIRDAGPARRIRGLKLAGEPLPLCLEPWPVTSAKRPVGALTSVAFSPDVGCNIALAMIDMTVQQGEPIAVATPAGTRTARLADLPFISSTG